VWAVETSSWSELELVLVEGMVIGGEVQEGWQMGARSPLELVYKCSLYETPDGCSVCGGGVGSSSELLCLVLAVEGGDTKVCRQGMLCYVG